MWKSRNLRLKNHLFALESQSCVTGAQFCLGPFLCCLYDGAEATETTATDDDDRRCSSSESLFPSLACSGMDFLFQVRALPVVSGDGWPLEDEGAVGRTLTALSKKDALTCGAIHFTTCNQRLTALMPKYSTSTVTWYCSIRIKRGLFRESSSI